MLNSEKNQPLWLWLHLFMRSLNGELYPAIIPHKGKKVTRNRPQYWRVVSESYRAVTAILAIILATSPQLTSEGVPLPVFTYWIAPLSTPLLTPPLRVPQPLWARFAWPVYVTRIRQEYLRWRFCNRKIWELIGTKWYKKGSGKVSTGRWRVPGVADLVFALKLPKQQKEAEDPEKGQRCFVSDCVHHNVNPGFQRYLTHGGGGLKSGGLCKTAGTLSKRVILQDRCHGFSKRAR